MSARIILCTLTERLRSLLAMFAVYPNCRVYASEPKSLVTSR
jgi:hypothetical protein